MAKNMCYAAQQVLHDRDREGRGPPMCPVAMTSKQEREAQGGNTTYWCKSGKDLWKLKSQQPHLFARQNQSAEADAPKRSLPPGFEETASPGWLWNPERKIFLETATHRLLWLDSAAGVHRELAQGMDLAGTLAITGGAATSPSRAPEPGRAARHVVIMDLHKAAEAFKLDLGHLDRPAAMLAVYGSVVGAVPAELAARALHEKLLKRLGAFRSRWSDEALQAAVVEAFVECSDPGAEKCVAAAVALLLGSKLIAAAAHGAVCAVAAPDGEVTQSVCGEGTTVRGACMDLAGSGALCVLLLTEAIRDSARTAAVAQAARGRPRASAVSLLQDPPAETAPSPRAAACARLTWSAPDADPTPAGPASKRHKAEPSSEARVRCRQILLKYVGCCKPTDSVRRRPVRRTLAQAETALLGVLRELDEGGDAAFAKQCRAVSECSSSLKGGDLVGDVGWLTRPVEKVGERPSKEVASRHAVIRAAFDLEVGELSDILVSDDGVHVLQRRA